MKFINIFSLDTMKYFFVIGILTSLTLSTTLESLSLLSENSFEIVKGEWQEDSQEETENQREKLEKKIQPQILSYNYWFSLKITTLLYVLSESYKDSFLEIYSPPPELV